MGDIWKIRSLVVAMAPLLICGAKNSHAEFLLNFAPQTGANVVVSIANLDCNRGNFVGGFAGVCGQDPTPFLSQVVVDATTGIRYFHTIIGNPALANSFGQQTYIRILPGPVCWNNCGAAARVQGGMGGLDAMGNGPAPLTASAGSNQNESAPLSSVEAVSGSGTGNPTQVHMRQINNEAGFTQEFFKDRDATKPRITQTVTTPDITSTFSVDMRAIGYGTNTAVAPMINTVVLTNAGVPASVFPAGTSGGNFNMADFTATSKVTAGKYTYTAGAGDGGSSGTYTYVDGAGFNVIGAEWGSFCNPVQNPISTCVTFGRFGVFGGGGGMGGGGMGGGGQGGGM